MKNVEILNSINQIDNHNEENKEKTISKDSDISNISHKEAIQEAKQISQLCSTKIKDSKLEENSEISQENKNTFPEVKDEKKVKCSMKLVNKLETLKLQLGLKYDSFPPDIDINISRITNILIIIQQSLDYSSKLIQIQEENKQKEKNENSISIQNDNKDNDKKLRKVFQKAKKSFKFNEISKSSLIYVKAC